MAAPQQRQCEIACVHRGAGACGQRDRGDEHAARLGRSIHHDEWS
jgi:hypothetical protein